MDRPGQRRDNSRDRSLTLVREGFNRCIQGIRSSLPVAGQHLVPGPLN